MLEGTKGTPDSCTRSADVTPAGSSPDKPPFNTWPPPRPGIRALKPSRSERACPRRDTFPGEIWGIHIFKSDLLRRPIQP